ncbi:hypothetical protein Cme02nite_01550 [Catellatospora methionotrophica]|uniref:Lipoprotein n=1 Tax=Catellatospora methionotrophica TaxID=121620 RepID=A0A8J3PCY0_9ACTN|nr:hypothetical protein [Catellatospora methionotrophica]GIG11823.1 hypothetical protein Cme02nite_01550 [Catellatospora methionotrophica]
MNTVRRIAGLLLATASLAACSGDPDLDLDVRTAVAGTEVTVEYTLANRSDTQVVVYDGGWTDPQRPGWSQGPVEVSVRDDGVIELSRRIIHACQTPDTSDCGGVQEPTVRMHGSVLEPGASRSDSFRVPLRVEPDHPVSAQRTPISLAGEKVVFCIGFTEATEADPPAADGLYPPGSPQTVLCGDPVQLP